MSFWNNEKQNIGIADLKEKTRQHDQCSALGPSSGQTLKPMHNMFRSRLVMIKAQDSQYTPVWRLPEPVSSPNWFLFLDVGRVVICLLYLHSSISSDDRFQPAQPRSTSIDTCKEDAIFMRSVVDQNCFPWRFGVIRGRNAVRGGSPNSSFGEDRIGVVRGTD